MWSAFSATGKSDLVFVEGNIDSRKYCSILCTTLLSFVLKTSALVGLVSRKTILRAMSVHTLISTFLIWTSGLLTGHHVSQILTRLRTCGPYSHMISTNKEGNLTLCKI